MFKSTKIIVSVPLVLAMWLAQFDFMCSVPLNIVAHNEKQNRIASILEYLDERASEFRLAKQIELLLVLGDTGADKTVLVLLLTEADMEAVIDSSGDYVFVDKYGLINKYSSSSISELIDDKNSGSEYYVCPSHSNTTNIQNEISAVYYIQRVLKIAEAVKFVFTIEYSSIKDGSNSAEERQMLREFVVYISTLIRDIEKFRNGIAFVVQGVENDSNDDDRSVLDFIASLLILLKKDFEDEYVFDDSNANKIKLIDILLEQENDEYKRIGIVRLANQTGSVHNISYLQDERRAISNILRNNTKFIGKNETDFLYNVSETIKKYLPVLIIELQKRIIVDISRIASEIHNYIFEREKRILDINVQYDQMSTAYEHVSQIDSTNLSFGKNFIDAINALGIDVSIDKFKVLLDHIELQSFFYYLGNINYSLQLEIGLKSLKSYLNESMIWYEFAINLQDILSEYSVQKNLTQYQLDTARLMSEFSIEEYEEKNIDDTGLKQFLRRIDTDIYCMVQNMSVNAYKLNTLKAIFNTTMNTAMDQSVLSNRLMIKGYNIRISDIINILETIQVDSVEIFALNKIFIDANIDKRGQNVQIIMIAPTWEIVDERKIILKGANGTEHSPSHAPDAENQLQNGEKGKPGKAGGPGGSFFGIANTFTNDENLEIDLSGGVGGAAQHGGKGANGIEGEDPPIPDNSTETASVWNSLNFTYQLVSQSQVEPDPGFIHAIKHHFRVWAKEATRPTNGGDGGKGGIGGHPGVWSIIGLNSTPNFSIFNESGKTGMLGKGGKSGIRVTAVKFKDVVYIDQYDPSGEGHFGAPNVTSTSFRSLKGNDGFDGINDNGIECPIEARKLTNISFILNDYKTFVRDNLANSIIDRSLKMFLQSIEGNRTIQMMYNALSYAHDLYSLENHYYQLQNRVSFVPFIESLLRNTAEFANNISDSGEYKQILILTHTTALSKLCAIKVYTNRVLAIGLLEELELLKDKINRLHEAESLSSIMEYQREYKKDMDSKIGSSFRFIKVHLTPEIKDVESKIRQNIIMIIDDIIDRSETSENEINDLIDKKNKLEDLVRAHQIQEINYLSNSMLIFWSSIGKAVIGALGGNVSIAESFLRQNDNESSPSNTTIQIDSNLVECVASLNASLLKMRGVFVRQHVLFFIQLQDIDYGLSISDRKWSEQIRMKVKELMSTILERLESDEILNSEEIRPLKDELFKIFYKNHPHNSPENNLWDNMMNILIIFNVSPDLYTDIRTNYSKIKTMAEAIANVEKRMEPWKISKISISKTLLLNIRNIREDIMYIGGRVLDGLHVEFNITKWQIQECLNELKIALRNITHITVLPNTIEYIFDQLDEAIALFINVYHRIDTYADKVKFLAYYLHTFFHSNVEIIQPELKEIYSMLQKAIRSNRVLENYIFAIYLLRQYQFPFAYVHSALLELPRDLQFNDTEKLIQITVSKIDYLIEQIRRIQTSVGPHDSELFANIDFKFEKTNASNPFFTWENYKFRNEIIKLLNGKEVVIRADISKGIPQNAIKFNEIRLNFELENEYLQSEFNETLERFDISMSMLDNNYYRCGSRFYYISIDERPTIKYSLKNGIPSEVNNVYRQISEKGYFFSPYVVWKIKLEPRQDDMSYSKKNFQNLTKFLNDVIDLKLIGYGQYFKNTEFNSIDICNDQLDLFYHLDNTTSTIFALNIMKYQYSL